MILRPNSQLPILPSPSLSNENSESTKTIVSHPANDETTENQEANDNLTVAEKKSHMGKIIGLLGGLSLGAITSSIVCFCAPGALVYLAALFGIPFVPPAVIAVV
ncbi:MAG: hypothetical protein LBG86_00355, partial [Puniceicoccales bacterium]|nr:hypothetical protein [Puniceicoccales bacterium]